MTQEKQITLTLPAESIHAQSLGFDALSVRVDNPTGQWFRLREINKDIPPYVVGIQTNFLSRTQVANIEVETPAGMLSAPVAGQIATFTYSVNPLPESPGIHIPRDVRADEANDILNPLGTEATRLLADFVGTDSDPDTIVNIPLRTNAIQIGLNNDTTFFAGLLYSLRVTGIQTGITYFSEFETFRIGEYRIVPVNPAADTQVEVEVSPNAGPTPVIHFTVTAHAAATSKSIANPPIPVALDIQSFASSQAPHGDTTRISFLVPQDHYVRIVHLWAFLGDNATQALTRSRFLINGTQFYVISAFQVVGTAITPGFSLAYGAADIILPAGTLLTGDTRNAEPVDNVRHELRWVLEVHNAARSLY